ncbi:MAG: LysR family transcriptional regulator [Lachnospiraceae bacterium]|nr:LysR family transcriptional regulator [Lachnospiraceae bacterium]
MNTTSLYYFIEAAKDLNFTQTANRLFISQQNLSHHIVKLESYCGCRLFLRKPSLSLTYEGLTFLSYAKSAVAAEKNILASLSSMVNEDAGLLQIGMTTSKSIFTLPHILPDFYSIFPNVRVEILERPTLLLRERLLANKLDFAVGAFQPAPDLKMQHLSHEKVYLCMSDSLLRKNRPDFSIDDVREALHGVSVGAFPNLPVVFPHDNAIFSQILFSCYAEAGITPNIMLSVTYPQLYHQLFLSGTIAVFMVGLNLNSFLLNNPQAHSFFHTFPLLQNGELLTREIFLAANRNRTLTRPAQKFISLLQTALSSFDGEEESPPGASAGEGPQGHAFATEKRSGT